MKADSTSSPQGPPKSLSPQVAVIIDDTIPVNAFAVPVIPAGASDPPSHPPAAPILVTDGDEASVVDNMRRIVPYVLTALQTVLRSNPELARQYPDCEPHLHTPARIAEDPSRIAGDDITSYKPPWSETDAYASLRSTTMYEAAGSVLWCNPCARPGAEEKIIAGLLPTWQQVEDCYQTDFSLSGASAKSVGKQSYSKVQRLVFRTVITVIVDDMEMAKQPYFRQSLHVLTDFTPIMAWWLAMCEALRNQDAGSIIALWQAGLTVTLQVRTCLTLPQ